MPVGGLKIIMVGAEIQGEAPFIAGNSLTASVDNAALGLSLTAFPTYSGATDFEDLDYQKIALSVWVKNVEVGMAKTFFDCSTLINVISDAGYLIPTIDFLVGGQLMLQSINQLPADAQWHHFYLKIDTTGATEEDRGQVYLDGILDNTFTIGNSPGLNDTIFSTSNPGIQWEDQNIVRFTQSQVSDGYKMYQNTIFSGTLPTIAEVYNAGSPTNVATLSGAFSILDGDGSPYNDGLLPVTWIENASGTTVIDADIPV